MESDCGKVVVPKKGDKTFLYTRCNYDKNGNLLLGKGEMHIPTAKIKWEKERKVIDDYYKKNYKDPRR